MRRYALAVATLLFGVACSTSDRSSPTGPDALPPALRNTSASCLDYNYTAAQITTLLLDAYTDGSPDENSALGKWNNIQHQLSLGQTAEAKAKAIDLADFTLGKYEAGSLTGSEEQIRTFLNALFCFTGIDPVFDDLDNTWLINPGDPAQTLITDDGWAGVQIPANNVTEPSFVTIVKLPDQAALVTNLDKYPLNYDFSLGNAGGSGWVNPVVVGVCPASGIDPTVNARLVLGHQDPAGFELLPPADASFLDCSGAPPLVGSSLLRLVAGVVADSASLNVVGSAGVGGTADAFSPFGPVDPQIVGSAGAGGTADNFRLRGGFPSLNLLSPLFNNSCTPLEAPVGGSIDAACRPYVTFTTALGTPLSLPVTWAVETGGGSIAPNDGGTCGSFGTTLLQNTNSSGVTSVCWTLGLTKGTNTVTAVAGQGGDAIPGTYVQYSDGGAPDPTDNKIRFTATANPAEALVFVTQPAAGSSIVAGTNIPVTVNVVDKNGVLVASHVGPVTVATNQFDFAGGSTTTVNAVAGVATFSNLSITRAAAGYAIVAGATLDGVPRSTTGNTFDVVAGTAVTMTKLAGDNQTVAAGSAVPIAPKVLVQDVYGNPVGGLVVVFEAQNNGAAVTGATPATASDGTASVGSWTLIDGPNSLIAYLQSNALVFTTFSATGSSTLTVLNSCPVGGSGDAVSYPFWAPGSNKSIRQVELYLSSNGSANTPRTYTLALDARVGGFDKAVTATATVSVTLTGKTSQALPTAFRFPTAFASGNNTKVAFELRVLANPDGASLFYNTGPCGLGGCKPPKGCTVTQVSTTTPYPFGTLRRSSVAIRILGS